METIGDITVDYPAPRSAVVYIKQDEDVVVVYRDELLPLADALMEYSPSPVEEPEPAPEMWYVVLKNSNSRLLNRANDPITFSVCGDARIYGRRFDDCGHRYVPISVDEYERAFGR